ncbi:cytochrome P450 [Xylogone sp. PMI_703]|nr:cytochrome P450 [Xylogone sp. PMI_703]
MISFERIADYSASNPKVCFTFLLVVFLFRRAAYRVIFHPLSHIPGPLLPKITSLWLYWHAYIGDEATVIHRAHLRYGPLVRVAPNEVDISDADAIAPIYISKGGFLKAPCYVNFDIDGHGTIFSALDNDYRSPRAKAVLPMFSTKSLKENQAMLYQCVDRMVQRMKDESRTGRPVNVLNITRSLAVDFVSTHLFLENYDGTSEKGKKLSVSAFVDAFVAVGRFFYLPNTVFIWLEWAIEKCFANEHVSNSMDIVDSFVSSVTDVAPEKPDSYAGRLTGIDLDITEVKAQCKDLMFAGTDSTGMNLATICRQLALHPHKYQFLYDELHANKKAGSERQEIQGLPYLSAVIKEGLRISMANPTRLPRVVPPEGWTFKGVHFPGGSIVGCGAYELHLNPEVFPNPHEFQPERWLESNVTAEAAKHWFAFGAGPRACIARNLAMLELYMATERLVESDVLRGAKVCKEDVEIYEWFNSKVKDEKIEIIFDAVSVEV